MFEFLSANLLWSQAPHIVVLLAVTGFVGVRWSKIILWLSIAAFAFCLFFFRNPDRLCVDALYNNKVVVCPADGVVVDVVEGGDGLPEGFGAKVAIFLSVSDVHVNWTPTAGTIEDIQYCPGEFCLAYLPKSSQLNERNDVLIRRDDGVKVLVRQIAGTIARKIATWVEPGQHVDAGYKYGMIKFGSRVEVFLPHGSQLNVCLQQRVYGGHSVIGILP